MAQSGVVLKYLSIQVGAGWRYEKKYKFCFYKGPENSFGHWPSYLKINNLLKLSILAITIIYRSDFKEYVHV